MIDRAIEDWLTKTNERNYQAAFCQVLMHAGHRVLYSSSHGPMEQGKDILTVGPDGTYNAYQTKTGNISLSDWRAISGEIQELVELPIDYPGVDKLQGHKAFLVMNGEMSDPVRVLISDRNEDNIRQDRRYAQLVVIERPALLKMFIDAQGHFVPRDLPNVRAFLELYLTEGAARLPRERLFNLLDQTIFGQAPRRKSDAIDTITRSVVIVSYLLNTFEHAKNYFAMAEGWSILAASMTRYAARWSAIPERWLDSRDLVMAELEANLASLRREAVERDDFLEGDIRADGAGMLRARTTIVLGALACHELIPGAGRRTDKDPDAVLSLIHKHLEQRGFWGDSAFPYVFWIIKFLESRGQSDIAMRLLIELFQVLVETNYAKQGPVFPSPYIDIEEILENDIPDRIRETDFQAYRGSSWTLRSVLEMLVRRNRNDLVRVLWRKFTYCELHEFVPDRAEDILTWRTLDGINQSGFPNQCQSWASLCAECADQTVIPELWSSLLGVLPFHLLVCPHRALPRVVRLLDIQL